MPKLLPFLVCFAVGCDAIWTDLPQAGDDFESPLEGLTPSQLKLFVEGDEAFERSFTVAEGLGPIFNNTACEACHPGDGRGTAGEALVRFSLGGDLALALGGPQLQDRAIPGVTPESLPSGALTSVRMPPPVFGMGLIEAIPEETILALADPDDDDGDGISGRPNWVDPMSFVPDDHVGGGAGPQLGRFGRKANVASLLGQVATAYHQDMGLTSDFLPTEIGHPQAGQAVAGDDVPDPEVPGVEVEQATAYVRLLAPPRRGPTTDAVQRGEDHFGQLGCAGCHTPTLRTGPHVVAPLNEVDAHLYSDLLLHDMGEELADGRGDGSADGYEWRTAPLWGLRLVPDFLGGRAFYLHDGRARSLNDAILLHGGEAAASRDAFESLPGSAQADLIAFLESL